MQLHSRIQKTLRRLAAALLAACLLAGAAQAAAPATDYLPVLMYHHFDEDTQGSKMIVSPERFSEQMQALADAGYTAVTPEQIVDYVDNGTPLPEKPVWISMDDGYESNRARPGRKWPVRHHLLHRRVGRQVHLQKPGRAHHPAFFV